MFLRADFLQPMTDQPAKPRKVRCPTWGRAPTWCGGPEPLPPLLLRSLPADRSGRWASDKYRVEGEGAPRRRVGSAAAAALTIKKAAHGPLFALPLPF